MKKVKKQVKRISSKKQPNTCPICTQAVKVGDLRPTFPGYKLSVAACKTCVADVRRSSYTYAAMTAANPDHSAIAMQVFGMLNMKTAALAVLADRLTSTLAETFSKPGAFDEAQKATGLPIPPNPEPKPNPETNSAAPVAPTEQSITSGL